MSRAGTHHVTADVAIVGSGFAGSLTALALRARGRSVAVLERGRHPRFAIGESSTPLANVLLEQLCDRYGLDAVRPFTSWGRWTRERPDVTCGLKRGFSFYFHQPDRSFAPDPTHARQLLVAASPHDEVADTHWYRPEFDAALVAEMRQAGVTYLDETTLHELRELPDAVALSGTRHGVSLDVRAGFLVDASGPHGFVSRALDLDAGPPAEQPATQGLYAHFADVETWASSAPADAGRPPYPVDAAALHHVFPGGWIWVLRFDNGITSAGAALTEPLAREIDASAGAPAWDRLLERLPAVQAQFRRARAVTPFVHAPRLPFRARRVVGRRWALLPSAAASIDPLLSTGFPLTLLGVHRLVEALTDEGPQDSLDEHLAAYEAVTRTETGITAGLIGALYACMDDPELFKRLTLLYFAAASFSEASARLDGRVAARGFLLSRDPVFAPALRACVAAARRQPQGADRERLLARIDQAIVPFDVAGLSDRGRRDWYPVRAGDLLASHARLGATRAEVESLLERCGLAPGVGSGVSM